MVDLSSYLVTGTNNSDKQVSVTYQNSLINAIETGINTAGAASSGTVSLADYLDEGRTPFVTDDLPAFEAALAAIAALESGDGGVPRLIVPAGRYYCSDTINVHCSCYIQGAGGNTAAGTLIRFAPNKNGFVFNYATTHGDGLGAQGDSTGSTLEGVYLYGGNVTVNGSGVATSYANGSSASGHGVRIRAPFVALKDVAVSFFGGDGFNISCTAGGADDVNGNANSFYLERCQSIYNGRYGYLFSGNDANAGLTLCCSAISNAGCGFVDYSFLGNTHIQPHTRDNGYVDATGCTNPVGACTYGGSKYWVRANKLTEASTTTPGTDSSVWVESGGIQAPRTWVSGQTWVIPGGYVTNIGNTNARNVFIGAYGESGQGPVQSSYPSIFLGGLLDEMTIGDNSSFTASWLRSGAGRMSAGCFESTTQGSSKVSQLGENRGSPDADVWTNHDDGSDVWRFRSGGGAKITASKTNTSIWDWNANGINLASGKALYNNNTQVVGAQGAAVADATDAATAITQLNALLARLRTHGLIAT